MAPAVKGMEKAHGGFFVVGGTGLHDGADQHFDQSAAHGVNDDTGHQPHKRSGKKLRQKGQPHKPRPGADMGDDDGDAVPDPVDKGRGDQVDHKLQAKIKGHKKGDPGKGYPVRGLKGKEKQGQEIIDDSLHNVACKTGINGMSVSELFHL